MPPPEPGQPERADLPGTREVAVEAAVVLAAALALFALSRSNYLLFHSLAEAGYVFVALATFAFAWSSRRFERGYLLLVGSSLGWVGLIHLLHLFAYKGMGVFPDAGTDLPTQLWISARLLFAASLLAAPLFLTRPLHPLVALGTVGGVAALLLALVFTGRFPSCHVEGVGLTPFKVWSEYAISALLVGGLVALARRRGHFDPAVRVRLYLFFAASIGAELAFTAYLGVYDGANLVGHLLNLVGGVMLFRAILETGLRRPQRLLFRQLNDALEAQERLSRELAAAVRHRESFLSIAAHELKTPLTALRLQVHVLERTVEKEALVSPRLASAIAMSNRQVCRLTELIGDLLDASRIQQGRLAYRFEQVRLNELVRHVLEGFEEPLQSAGCPARLVEEGGVEGHWDRSRLEQVLVNLLSNAIKFAPGAPITLRVAGDERGARLEVEDSGSGLPDADHPRLFEAFERGSASAGVAGLGLGLYIVRQIVRAHGGEITVGRGDSGGARFSVVLPLEAPDEDGSQPLPRASCA